MVGPDRLCSGGTDWARLLMQATFRYLLGLPRPERLLPVPVPGFFCACESTAICSVTRCVRQPRRRAPPAPGIEFASATAFSPLVDAQAEQPRVRM